MRMVLWKHITRLSYTLLLLLLVVGGSQVGVAHAQNSAANASARVATNISAFDDDDGDDDPYPAQIFVLVKPSVNTVSQADGIITYTLEVTNRGRGHADNVSVTVPFEPSVSALLDATFDNENAWVSELNSNNLVFNTRKLKPRDTVTATVRIQTLSNLPDGTPLARRTTFFFADAHGGGFGMANLPVVVSGAADTNTATYPLAVDLPAAPQGSKVAFSTAVFVPNETVSGWYTDASGKEEPVDDFIADENGGVGFTFDTSKLAPGTYAMSLGGAWSGISAAATFTVQ